MFMLVVKLLGMKLLIIYLNRKNLNKLSYNKALFGINPRRRRYVL
jgi:hypothetical protein